MLAKHRMMTFSDVSSNGLWPFLVHDKQTLHHAAAPPREGLFFFSPRRAARGAVICFLMNELKKAHRHFLPPRDKQSMGQNSAKRDLPRFFCLLPRDQRKCPTTPVRN